MERPFALSRAFFLGTELLDFPNLAEMAYALYVVAGLCVICDDMGRRAR
jgi:hypothetical protein